MSSRWFPLFLVMGLFLGMASPALAADASIPLDPVIRSGELPNGLRYFIRRNAKPEQRAELRLAVNAGSVLEENDQQGLAHFVEHMAFNGTTHFAHNDLVDFLESVGSRFGPDLNAYTSFDETVYMLQIPTDKEGLLEKGFTVLSDWAHGMTMDPEEIEKERGVVLEEWRLGRGAQERLQKVQWPVLLGGSRYADRMPIGQDEIIKNAPGQRVRDYYERWYRPDLMAVIAVGDFDVDRVETLIRDAFAGIPRPATPAERPVVDVPLRPETRAAGATDAEMPYTQVSLSFKHAPGERATLAAYREGLVEGLVVDMLNARFDEIRQKPDAPFLYAGGGSGTFVRRLDLFQVYAFCPEGGVERALTATATEIARVRAHGFTPGELERAKARVLSAVERSFAEREKTESVAYAGEAISHFLQDEPMPGIAWEYDRTREILPAVDLSEVTKTVARLLGSESTVILASAPAKEGALPDDPTLVRVAGEALATTPEAYVDVIAGSELLRTPPAPGTITARRHKPTLGVTVLTLSNGLEVWLKPTDFKNDQILLGARVRGGLSLVDPAQYASAQFATGLVEEAGLGGYTPTDLQKLLAGKICSMSPVLEDFSHGFSGSATPRDLETALQLLVLYVTAPNDRDEAFTVLQDRLREIVRNRLQSPEARFGDAVSAVNFQNHYMFRPLDLATVNGLDRAAAMAAYHRLFDDVSGYRFYVVGAFDPEVIEPLITRYLASLPAPGRESRNYVEREVRFPATHVEKTVNAGTDPKGSVVLSWPAMTGMDEMKMFHLRKANEVLEIRLREILREELGGTYSVSVGYSSLSPYAGYEATRISFGCAPEKTAPLTERVLAEVEKMRAEGITAEEVAKVRELEIRGVEEGMKRNEYWLTSFLTLDLLGWDPERILARRERAEALTAEALHRVFSENFPPERITVVTRLPERGSE